MQIQLIKLKLTRLTLQNGGGSKTFLFTLLDKLQ